MAAAARPLKTFSLETVAAHNCRESLGIWLIIGNGVYDVTQFIDEHPGGGDLLLMEAGGDATEAFEKTAHSSDAKHLMQKHKIGQLNEEDKALLESRRDTIWDSMEESPRSSWKSSWIASIALGIAGALLYRFYKPSDGKD